MSASRRPIILICDDDQTYQLALRQFLKKDFDILSAYNADEAFAIVKNRKVDLLLLDVRMRTEEEGLDSIPKFKSLDEDLTIVMLSGLKEFETVREAMRRGAHDYFCKDIEAAELTHILARLLERRQLIQRGQQQNFEATQLQSRHSLIGKSASMVQLKKMLERIRSSNANVVIYGETGSGKEVVARLLRGELSDGTLAPFVAVDSSTIHNNTAESILFGHEKGAFTGADKPRKGIFEEANGGIVYFDEIANMPLDIQAKLLRVIQEKEITRLGSARSIPLDFRIVCATNRKLEELIKLGLFKDDLYQRLNVIPLVLPPLRERREDIPDLLHHFSHRHTCEGRFLQFTEEAIQLLQTYDWPGNIRELGNLVAYLYAVTDQEIVDIADLPPKFRDVLNSTSRVVSISESTGNFYERVAKFESDILKQEYENFGGNISRLALKLGMDRSHLYTKLKLYGLHTTSHKTDTSNATIHTAS